MRLVFSIALIGWSSWWLTADQQGQRYYDQAKFQLAAEAFSDPMHQGCAWYRAGEFEKAVASFSLIDSPESQFNSGNSWLMLGKYEQAIDCYQEALHRRPDWKEARENLILARARANALKATGADLGDQREGADDVVFSKKKEDSPEGEDTPAEGAASESLKQAAWLRHVQTKPADFLKSKFAYQLATQEETEE